MTMKQEEKKKNLAPALQNNKRLAKLLSKAMEETAEKEKKLSYKGMTRVGVNVDFFKLGPLLQIAHHYLELLLYVYALSATLCSMCLNN